MYVVETCMHVYNDHLWLIYTLYVIYTCIRAHAAPSAPPTAITIEEVGSRHINISWQPPQAHHQNGLIRSYQVNLLLNDLAPSNESRIFTTSLMDITLSNLLPYRDYTFTVTPITLSRGPESDPFQFQTLEDGK